MMGKKISDECAVRLPKAVRYVREEKFLFILLAALVLSLLPVPVASYIYGVSRSIGNAFIQSLWFYLAVFGIAVFAGKRIGKIVLISLFVIHGLETITSLFLLCCFHLALTADVFFVLMVSSTGEIREFLDFMLSFSVILGLLAGIFCIAVCLFLICRARLARSVFSLLTAVLLVLPFLINVVRFSLRGDYEDIMGTPGIPLLCSNFFRCRNDFRKFIRMEREPKLPAGIRRGEPQKKITGLLVIGESASRSHMGLYGYPRQTTPALAAIRPELVLFDDVISAAANTVLSLRYLLTTANLADEFDLRYTLFDVLKRAGYRTDFISKQAAWGDFDGPIGIFTAHADRRQYIHKKQPDALDDACIAALKSALAENQTPHFIAVQLMGSHRQFFCRYPREFAVFDGRKDEVSAKLPDKWQEETNQYDNSILFTDFVLGKMIGEMKKTQGPAFVLYISDHGEAVASKIKRSSASLNKMVYEIPCVFWANDAYRKAFPEVMKAAEKNRHSPGQTDVLLYSVLAALDVSFDGFPKQHALFSPDYQPPAKRLIGTQGMLYVK